MNTRSKSHIHNKMSTIKKETDSYINYSVRKNIMIPSVRRLILEDCLSNAYNKVATCQDAELENEPKQNETKVINSIYSVVLPNGYTIYIEKNH